MVLGLTMSELRTVSLILQIAALLLIVIGSIVLKTSPSAKEGVSKHGKIITGGYVLAALSVLYMAYSAYSFVVATSSLPSAIIVHGSFGIIAMVLGLVFVTNRWSWKTKKNMWVELVVWSLTFLGGISLYLNITGAV